MNGGSVNLEMPAPNPWLMGIVMVGAGVTLWWLAPSFERRPNVMRAYYEVSTRVGSVFMIIAGLVVLGVQIARA